MKQIQCDVRMRILLAARKLFAQRGYDATTVRQICKEAKSNLALVSYHFGGKENVFFSLFDAFFPMDMICLNQVPIDPVACIRQIVESLIRFKIEQPEIVAIIQQEILMDSPRLEGLGPYIYPVYSKLREYLEIGQKNKLFHFKSIDNSMRFIMAIIAFPLSNAFISQLVSDNGKRVDGVYEDTLKFIFDGLGYNLEKTEVI